MIKTVERESEEKSTNKYLEVKGALTNQFVNKCEALKVAVNQKQKSREKRPILMKGLANYSKGASSIVTRLECKVPQMVYVN